MFSSHSSNKIRLSITFWLLMSSHVVQLTKFACIVNPIKLNYTQPAIFRKLSDISTIIGCVSPSKSNNIYLVHVFRLEINNVIRKLWFKFQLVVLWNKLICLFVNDDNVFNIFIMCWQFECGFKAWENIWCIVGSKQWESVIGVVLREFVLIWKVLCV